ncbi:MAG: C1 family peptidase [Clostridiales bacterium]|nr:C1 family peptidase [Clostridiales bacterium]
MGVWNVGSRNMTFGLSGSIFLLVGMLSVLLMPICVWAAASNPDYEYILGRPMTEEEIEEQKALEPELSVDYPLELPAIEQTENSDPEPSRGVLPTSFDARDYGWITSVKNQRPYGTCWAFSAIASAETSMIQNGLLLGKTAATMDNADLSELQLTYFFYNSVADRLGNTKGDATKALTDSFLEQGGNGIFSTFALSTWMGVVKESKAPYENASSTTSLKSSLAYSKDVAHMQNAYWIPLTDIEGVKELVMKYGNVGMSYYHLDQYYNYSTGAYYNNQHQQTNHAVNIVGWDDNYSRKNFLTRPSSNGAWLVKNNWGSEWGDQGYFWISYEDLSFQGANAFGYVYLFEAADNYDNIYQYDGSFGYSRCILDSGDSVANVFTVEGSDYERLSAVSIALYTPDVKYTIQVYLNPSSSDPTSGIPMLDTPQVGYTSYVGYHTIPLEQKDVVFSKGDRFSVVFCLEKSGDEQIAVFEDYTYVNGGWVSFINDTKPGQSYLKYGNSWTDLGVDRRGNAMGTGGETIRVKAFTENTSAVPIQSVQISQSDLSLYVGKTKTLTARIIPNHNTEEMSCRWTTSNPSVASVSNGKITAVGAGTCVITAKAGSRKASCTVTVQLKTPVWNEIKAVGYEQIQLTWNSVKGAQGYRIYRRVPGGKWERMATLKGKSSTTWKDSSAIGNTVYEYRMRAYSDASGTRVWGDYTDPYLIVSQPKEPSLKKVKITDQGVKVTWEPVLADGYRVYRRAAGGKWERVAELTGKDRSSYVDIGGKAGVEYQYTVRAFFRKNKKVVLSTYNKKGLTILLASETN